MVKYSIVIHSIKDNWCSDLDWMNAGTRFNRNHWFNYHYLLHQRFNQLVFTWFKYHYLLNDGTRFNRNHWFKWFLHEFNCYSVQSQYMLQSQSLVQLKWIKIIYLIMVKRLIRTVLLSTESLWYSLQFNRVLNH